MESPKKINDWKNGLTGTARRGRKSSNDRKVIEAIIYLMRTGLPWRDLPAWFGNWKTLYSRFSRYSKTTLWNGILNTLRALFSDPEWVMVDATIMRVHQDGCGAIGVQHHQSLGQSRGGLTSKFMQPVIH